MSGIFVKPAAGDFRELGVTRNGEGSGSSPAGKVKAKWICLAVRCMWSGKANNLYGLQPSMCKPHVIVEDRPEVSLPGHVIGILPSDGGGC